MVYFLPLHVVLKYINIDTEHFLNLKYNKSEMTKPLFESINLHLMYFRETLSKYTIKNMYSQEPDSMNKPYCNDSPCLSSPFYPLDGVKAYFVTGIGLGWLILSFCKN